MYSRHFISIFLLIIGITTVFGFEVPVIESVNGLLEATLTVDLVTSLNGTRIGPGYNGGPIGPTFRAKAGDKIKITILNNLEPSSSEDVEFFDFVLDPNVDETLQTIIYNRLTSDGNVDMLPREEYWGKKFMNLHFHGLMVDPSIEMNREVAVDGGGNSYTYEFDIPENHQGGLTWYHNHFHGTAAYSSLSGLHGAFIVTPKVDPYAQVAEDPSAVEVVLVLAESFTFPDGEPQNSIPLVMNFDWEATTNGVHNPTFTFKQGQTAYFRAINAGERPPICISIEDHELVLIAADSTFPSPDTGSSLSTICIGAGSRNEFYVAFDTPGVYTVYRNAFNFGGIQGPVCDAVYGIPNVTNCVSYDKETIAATIVVEAVDNPVPSNPVNLTPRISSYLEELLQQPDAGEREVSLDIALFPPIFQLPFMSSPPATGLGVNNRLANANFILGDIRGGTCEDWTVYSNPPGLVAHPFHVHSVPILIQSIDGVDVEEPFWRDTFPVAFNFTGKVCFPPQKESAFLSVHCHMPHHQDGGMAGYFRLLPSLPSTSSSFQLSLGGAYLSLMISFGLYLFV